MKLNPVSPAPPRLAPLAQAPAPAPPQEAPWEEGRQDTIELSQEAQDYLKEQEASRQEEPVTLTAAEKRMAEKAEQLSAAQQLLQTLKQQNEQIREQTEKQADAIKKAMDKMKKCMKIAHSILKGKRVPPEDEQYLLENDLKNYMMAMALREMKKDPEKEKSVLDKEDLQDGQEQSQAPEAPEAAAEVAETTEA